MKRAKHFATVLEEGLAIRPAIPHFFPSGLGTGMLHLGQVPITEEEPQHPINPYGRAKLAVEWASADYARAYGLAYAALRY